MKVGRLFTIDVELAERLKNIENQSSLINQLLSEYFNVRGEKYTFFDQKRAVISDLKKNLKFITKKSKLLLNLKNLILIILQSLGLKKRGLAKIKNQMNNQSENMQEAEKF